MRLWNKARTKANPPSLYRRAWRETSDPLVAEARAQTLALGRLQVWLRLAYSALALGALLGYWGLAKGGSRSWGIVGVVLGVVAFACVVVLRTGIAHGRKNVGAMLEVLSQRRRG